MTPEGIVKEEIKQWLSVNGWFHFPVIQDFRSARGMKGLPDRIALKKGVVLFIEVKTAKGVLSGSQAMFKALITEHDGHYVVARSYRDIDEYIKSM